MGQINQMVEQQIRAFEWQQRHVDDLTRQARLDQTRSTPARFAVKYEPHAEGLTGVLEVIGLQFEKAFTAILETGRR